MQGEMAHRRGAWYTACLYNQGTQLNCNRRLCCPCDPALDQIVPHSFVRPVQELVGGHCPPGEHADAIHFYLERSVPLCHACRVRGPCSWNSNLQCYYGNRDGWVGSTGWLGGRLEWADVHPLSLMSWGIPSSRHSQCTCPLLLYTSRYQCGKGGCQPGWGGRHKEAHPTCCIEPSSP